ncbi:MAG: hypothetical protein LLG42_02560, partial [Chloroflexi bacterium]|nr:hypothetical protein [Chloroflexota bacterium]
MKNKRLITKLTKVMYGFGILFLLTGLLLSAVQVPVSAQATTGGGGSIWTTRGDCGKLSQDVNQFSVGEDVYINGGGFAPTTTYNWFIIGNPGSSDAGIKVAEGTVTTNGQGKFCFYAYTIQEGDSGVYKNDVNGKNDNYSIRESTGSASLTLDKSTTTTGFNAVGDTINYSYVLTNSSTNFWIRLRAPYAVSDDKVSVTCPTTPAELGIGQSVTCTANPYTITQADLDRGFVTNVATATAKTGMDGSQTVTSNQDSETVEGTQNTGLGLQKSANPIIYSTEGEIIGYSYVLTNTGNVTLSAPFSVDDDVIGKFSCAGAPATLAPGASFTCSGGYSITLADLDNGSVTNHATASATFGGGVVNSGEKSATINASQNPALQIVKSSPQTVFSAASQSITYHYELTNMGNVTLTGFTVTDDKIGSVTNCDKTSLAPGESTTCSGTYTTTQADMDAGEVQNTAFGTGYFKSSPVQSAPDTLVIPAQGIGSQLSLVKLVDPTTYNAVSQELSYTYTLTNSGDVTLTGFNITDDKLGSITNCDKSTLAPTESTTCTASITITQADLDAGSITNKATGYGSYNSKQVVSNEASATATALGAAGLTLNKEVSPATFTAVGDVLDYTYTLTNSGAVTLSGPFTVSDDKATVVCPVDVTLGVGASIECTASYTITLADLNAGFVTNTATGHAVFNGSPVNSDPDSATANAQQVPALSLAKSATETSYDAVGDILHYSYQLTNIGNVTLTSPFTVTDDKTTVTCPASPTSLAPGEFTTCTADYTVTQADLDAGKVTNTAQGHVTYDASVIDSNFDSATVNADQNPALHLDKTADEDTFDAVGDILHYNYLVTNIGNVTLYDSFAVHDDRIGLVDCSAAPASLAPGASFICHGTFTIRQYDLNWGAVSNTAEARASTDPVDCCASVIWSNEDTLTVYGIKPGANLTLEKTVSPETYSLVGQVLTYDYKLINTGGVTLFGPFSVDDDKLTVDCSGAAASLEPTESRHCTASYTITQADLDAGEIINDAQAFGKDMWEATVSSNHDTATATGTQNPELTLEKTVL